MNEKVLNFAAWLVWTALCLALVWTSKAPWWVIATSLTWMLPSVDWVTVFAQMKGDKK